MRPGKRLRMILELSQVDQLAIRLRALKSGKTTTQVVAEAVEVTFPEDVKEARSVRANRLSNWEPQ